MHWLKYVFGKGTNVCTVVLCILLKSMYKQWLFCLGRKQLYKHTFLALFYMIEL